jgi:hypothetical protein
MPGGLGGGGTGRGNTAGSAGTSNTGGGGGGGLSGGGSGGSGYVVIVIPSGYTGSISAGLTYTLDTTGRIGYKIYKFTGGSGTITFSGS